MKELKWRKRNHGISNTRLDSVFFLLLIFLDRMNKARVDEGDVLEAAREMHGLEKMDQIKYAILERGGIITIIPKSEARQP